MTLFKQLRGVRGATTADEDTREAITTRISELLSEMLRRNGLSEDDLVSVLFTATNDLVAVFPATAARELGFATVPLICAQELDIT
ncbi:MAG: chorismate mutase, partial [Actinomycetota bacterium]